VAIQLKYTGRDVDDGSMSIEDMIPALQGFSSAYGKISNLDELQVKHKLRVVGVKKGSFDILLEVVGDIVDAVNKNKEITGLAISSTLIGSVIIKKIIGVISITKHTKNQSFETKVVGDKNIVQVFNTDKVSLEVPYEIFELFQSKLLQQDIAKIAKPLEEGRIDSTEIVVEDEGGHFGESITLEEKPYFEIETKIVTKTDLTELTGSFLSLYKKTNNGYFALNDGTRVSYHLAGKNPENLWPLFIHKGAVKVKCVVQIDENLKPALLEIYEVSPLQNRLFIETSEKN